MKLSIPETVEGHSLATPRAVSRTLSTRRILILILGASVALRLASALYQGDVILALPGIHDQISYDALARRVLAGDGFSFATDWWPLTRGGEPTAHWSYLYTLYLTAVYAVFGLHPLAARLIQAVVVGLLHPWLAWRIGRRVFGDRVGLVAAGMTALYAYFIYYAGALVTEAFYILAVLWMFDLALGMRVPHPERPRLVSLRPWLGLGLALGLAVLLRQLILLFAPFLFAWLFWQRRKQGEGMGRLAMGMLTSVMVVAALVAPWTARNHKVFGQWTLLNTNAGYAFFFANHPIYGTEFVPILTNESYQNLIPVELRGLNEASLDQALLREGVGFVVHDPLRYTLLSLSRVKYYFLFAPSAESGWVSNISRTLSFGLLLPFMGYGLFLSIVYRRRWVAAGAWSSVVLLLLFMAVYSLIHIFSWTLIRYRLPVDAILVVFAAQAATALTKQLGIGA